MFGLSGVFQSGHNATHSGRVNVHVLQNPARRVSDPPGPSAEDALGASSGQRVSLVQNFATAGWTEEFTYRAAAVFG